MKSKLLLPVVLCGSLLLAGCVSSKRLIRNSPLNSAGSKFHREGVNLWPLYYQEGSNRCILFPFVDIDEHGFAIRPLYHRDNDDHGILWPLCAFDSKGGWAGPFYWKNETYGGIYGGKDFGLIPLFNKDDSGTVWIFPASWYSDERNFGILPLFFRWRDSLLVLNLFKNDDMLLVLPFYGKGKDWLYFLNFLYLSDIHGQKTFCVPPLGLFSTGGQIPGDCLLTPLFSYETHQGKLRMLNIAMLLYHYSYGKHHFFYPFADFDFKDKIFWVWPLFNYRDGSRNEAPFFLFNFEFITGAEEDKPLDNYRLKILDPLLFSLEYRKNSTAEVEILPFGFLWSSYVRTGYSACRMLGGALWYSKTEAGNFDHRILGGVVWRNSKDEDTRRLSLLYKFFSYHRFKDDVKWEFFPFIKIMKTANGSSWSFCWRLLEKHDGGGHIFFIPWGKTFAVNGE